MVHPSDLLRTDSTGDGSFVAPVGDYSHDVDCGCKALPCLSERLNLEKYAKPGVFVGVLSALGFLHGMIIKYFRGTSQLWSTHYNLSEDTIDWILYINEVFVGVFALAVAYWGRRIHRPNWLGALTMYTAVASITLIIPEIYQPVKQEETDISNVNGDILCQVAHNAKLENISTHFSNEVLAVVILILYQVVYALVTISFVSHGITYIDDNISPRHSPAFIALVFAAQRMGKQAGIYSSWTPYALETRSIFITTVWLIVAILTLLVGFIVVMFPRIMPNTLLRKSVNSLLSIATGTAIVEDKNTIDGFFTSLWRILKNKVLLLNIHAMMFMQAAIVNFNILEKHFNQSKYHVSRYKDSSGYSDPLLIQFTTNLLKQPLIAVGYITTGMIIAKFKPKAKYLVMWNIKVFVAIAFAFAGIRFLSCTNGIKNDFDGKLTIPYCSWNCGCSIDGPFQPVCLNGDTYFSPCLAGCSIFDAGLKVYQNCTCGFEGKAFAADRSCDADNCSTLWALAQAKSVISSGLLGTAFITTLIINLRCVANKDKALALGLHLTFLSLIPYLPVRASYAFIVDKFCQIWGKSSCQFYSDSFAIFLATATIIQMAHAIICALILVFIIGDVELYSNNMSKKGSNVDLSVLRRNQSSSSNNNNETKSNNNPDTSSSDPQETTALINNPAEIILRNKQKSESGLDKVAKRTSKDERINSYLSEGDLVPPLKSNLKKQDKSNSRTSNSTSVISTDSSLNAIANSVGDDHDSDFSTLQRPLRTQQQEKQLRNDPDRSPPMRRPMVINLMPNKENNIIETEF